MRKNWRRTVVLMAVCGVMSVPFTMLSYGAGPVEPAGQEE